MQKPTRPTNHGTDRQARSRPCKSYLRMHSTEGSSDRQKSFLTTTRRVLETKKWSFWKMVSYKMCLQDLAFPKIKKTSIAIRITICLRCSSIAGDVDLGRGTVSDAPIYKNADSKEQNIPINPLPPPPR